MRIPLWLKILVILMLLSAVLSALGPTAGSYLFLVGFLALIFFPGDDQSNPRLVRWVPWLWALNIIAAVVLLGAQGLGKTLLSPEVDGPTNAELWTTLFFAPTLIWTLVKRHRAFRVILVISVLTSLGLQISDYSQSAQDTKAIITLVGEGLSELLLAAYLFVKVKTPRR